MVISLNQFCSLGNYIPFLEMSAQNCHTSKGSSRRLLGDTRTPFEPHWLMWLLLQRLYGTS
jgi:hypothetical protein